MNFFGIRSTNIYGLLLQNPRHSDKQAALYLVDRPFHHHNIQPLYLQPIITQYFIDNKSEIWLLFLIAHSKR